MPGFYKTGVVSTSEFLEPFNIITSGGSGGYTPAKDTQNSCVNIASIKYDLDKVTNTTVLRVVAEVSWSGFDTSSTAGTFGIWWQGSSFNTANQAWEWQGGNHITSALNAQYYPTQLVLSSSSGSYTYNTTYVISGSWLDTWSGSNIGFRSDYSNGVGKITVNSIKIYYDKYSTTSNIKQRFGKQYIATEEFIEI